ncbi:MAG TPA: efflux RND transporter periplasmic adaptor subunit [Flavobacterium sp.]|nr:efflux RND transporter periplasmic adaptor subunit [Flavobacterium sp.]
MRKSSILSTLILVLVLASCGKKQEQAPPPTGPMPFPVQKVVNQDAVIYQTYAANLEGQQNVEIRPKVNGFIQKIYVDEGQIVKKGQLLFKLETDTQNQDASGYKAAVQAAQVEVDRLVPLVDRKIISNVVLETAKAKLAQAKSAYNSINATIGFGTIKSPVDGIVGSIPFKEGSLVNATSEQPLTTVSDTRNMRAYFTLNEKELLNFNKTFNGATTAEKLKTVPQVELILVDNSVYSQKGKIETINGMMNAETGSTEFRAVFTNPQGLLRNGSTGTIRIPIQQKNVTLVPQNAVFEMQGKQIVYVVGPDNKVQNRIIETSGTSELNFIVTKGLEVGELVVIEGASKLQDGTQIVPQEKTAEATAPAADSTSTATPTKK